MDPGRKKFEEWDIQYVAVGDTVVTPAGVKWTVYYVAKQALMTERHTSDGMVYKMLKFRDHPTIRVEVERGPTH
jgi:hypothetical protein